MLKRISICVVFLILGVTSSRAQRQEAVLQRIELPGAGVEVLLATPKSPAVIVDLGGSPEALVVPLVGDALALVFEDDAEMVAALESLRYPGCSLLAPSKDGNPPRAISLYIAPKSDPRGSTAR